MYAIYGNIYYQYTPNVSIYTIHGSYGTGCRSHLQFGCEKSCPMINCWGYAINHPMNRAICQQRLGKPCCKKDPKPTTNGFSVSQQLSTSGPNSYTTWGAFYSSPVPRICVRKRNRKDDSPSKQELH